MRERLWVWTHSRVLILIDYCVVDNTFCTVSISQSRQALLIVVRGRAHRGNHHRLAVTTEIILQVGGVSVLLYIDAHA